MLKHLQFIRHLLDDPKDWTKGALAKNAKGLGLGNANHNEAVCFCLIGAIQRSTRDSTLRARISEFIRSQLPYPMQIDDFNDSPTTSHADVLVMLDGAIVSYSQFEARMAA